MDAHRPRARNSRQNRRASHPDTLFPLSSPEILTGRVRVIVCWKSLIATSMVILRLELVETIGLFKTE